MPNPTCYGSLILLLSYLAHSVFANQTFPIFIHVMALFMVQVYPLAGRCLCLRSHHLATDNDQCVEVV